jgi:preprotein translocase subunit SecB
MLVLTLKIASADLSHPFLYDVDIRVQGIVEMLANMLEDRKEQLALVNGFSILYGAAREMLSTVSARCAHGGVGLPTLSFAELVAEARKQRPEGQPSAAASPALAHMK